jgi:hypothetical protein
MVLEVREVLKELAVLSFKPGVEGSLFVEKEVGATIRIELLACLGASYRFQAGRGTSKMGSNSCSSSFTFKFAISVEEQVTQFL